MGFLGREAVCQGQGEERKLGSLWACPVPSPQALGWELLGEETD